MSGKKSRIIGITSNQQGEFKHYQSLVEKVLVSLKAAEEAALKEVLRQILRREPTIEDAKLCQQYFDGIDPNKYQLFYRTYLLGTVYINFGREGEQPGVTFKPSEQPVPFFN